MFSQRRTRTTCRAIALVTAVCTARLAPAATYVVCPDGSGDFPAIQDAIDYASGGDVIELCDGTFTGPRNRNLSYLGKAITVRSQSGDPALCIIDCEQQSRGFRFTSGEGSNSVLESVTITNGSTALPDQGAGIDCEYTSPRITNCIITNNTAEGDYGKNGGGLSSRYGSPTITGCTFSYNTLVGMGGRGGGMAIYGTGSVSPMIADCVFVENTAFYAGGADAGGASNTTFTGCVFLNNNATTGGGAMVCAYGASIIINDCTFAGNTTDMGLTGGIHCINASPTISGCTFYGNQAGTDGGLIFCVGSSYPDIQSTIIAFSTGGPAVGSYDGGVPTLTCSNIYGNGGGDWVGVIADQLDTAGNICFDPLFCDPDAGDLFLDEASPCAPFSPPNPECGLIGAWPVGCVAMIDCNDNGIPDDEDIADGTSEDCNENGVPDQCDLADGFSSDCNENLVPDECDIADGTSVDCNDNLVPDECDLADGTSADCNENGVPDECDLEGGTSEDCNENGVPDECDIADGTSEDVNGNGIPDECENENEIYVPDDHPTIQAAINAAGPDATVIVRDGTYTGSGNKNLDFHGKAITVRSENGPDNCTIDCETSGRGFYFHTGETRSSVVEGFTIINGIADRGGAIWCGSSSPTVRDCALINNRASGAHGGGVYSSGSSPLIVRTLLQDNRASGGTYNHGGGMYLTGGSPEVIACTFIENRATGGHYAYGGGVYISGGHPTFIDCLFQGNHCSSSTRGTGGGIHNINGILDVVNCTFHDNWASGSMFGMAGGIYTGSGGLTVTNCILWENTDDGGMDESAQIHRQGPLDLNYTCLQGLTGVFGGVGNIGDDPEFVDPENGNCRLSPYSPCIDAADNTAVPSDVADLDEDGDVVEQTPLDLDGDDRFVDDPMTADTGYGEPPLVDMGVYEYQGVSVCPWDINGDGYVDVLDLLAVLAAWGATGDLPEDVNDDGVVDILDLLAVLGAWGPCP